MNRDPRRDPAPVAEAIRNAKTVAICCHVNPDGDTIGSGLATRLGLEKLGIRADVYCQDKVPDNLMFLPGAKEVLNADAIGEKRYDLLLCVDISDAARMGKCALLRDRCAAWAQVDHHGTNPAYATCNDIDGNASANCLLIYELLNRLNVAVDGEIAKCLYAGISTDTGNFAFSNTGSEAFKVMSELMEHGLPLQDMNRILFRERAKEQVLLMGRMLSRIQYRHQGQMAVMTLTAKDFEECGALPEHADTLVNVGLDTVGVKTALLAREHTDGTIKFSLRAVAPWRVDQVASAFGGGGHSQASGISMKGELSEVTEKVAQALEKAMDGKEL